MITGRRLKIVWSVVLLTSITSLQQQALGLGERDRRLERAASFSPVKLLPLSDVRKPTQLEQAYLDSFSILKSENQCSAFFGGPSAIAALNELTQQLRPTHLDRRVGIRMSGQSSIFISAVTGFTFRLFDKAEINLDGPFYRANTFSGNGRVPQIGPFNPNTREARVTTVLHELGHLIRKDGNWLLPNDGENSGESIANTQRVLDVCGEQIRELHNFSLEEELAGAHSAVSLKPAAGPGD
jgi:hypothetical protein